MKVLLVEDCIQATPEIVMTLELLGHEVVWVNGILTIDDAGVIAPNQCGLAVIRYPRKCRTTAVLPTEFDVALLDGDPDGVLRGWEIAERLQVPCIGISSSAASNERIAAASGAPTFLKSELCAALRNGTLDFATVRAEQAAD